MNFSFAGCGFLGIYHVGVAACLKKYAPNLLVNKISGASAGALAAVCLLCDSPLGTITSSVLKTATEARRRTLGPFSPTFNVEKLLREGLLSILPDDAHKIVSGKLFISVTRVSDGKNILLSQFDTREELVQAILCSAFIPGFSGWLPVSFRGVRYIDGGFSDNLPVLDDNTVTVSPFCGESDICPRDSHVNFMQINLANTSIELSKENLYRFARILFPPPPQVLNKMCQQGFNDALDFLQRNNLINCTRCLAVSSKFNITEAESHSMEMDELGCLDCCKHGKEAIIDQLPEAVGCILQDAINNANQGLMNWVFKHKSMKLLSILTLPYVLPIDVAYAAFLKFMGSAPTTHDIKNLAGQMITLVQAMIRSSSQSTLHHQHHHDSKFSCQLAITQFSGQVEMQHLQNRHNFDFTLDLDDLKGVPQSHKDAMLLESQALTEVALRCAARSVSRATSRPGSRIASRCASRAVSRAVSRRPSLNDLSDPSLYDGVTEILPGQITDDAFEQILDVTNRQEALMAYYYLDDNNEVQVTEIFDMTKDDGSEGGVAEGDVAEGGVAEGGIAEGEIEMDDNHWDLRKEILTKNWSQRVRNTSCDSQEDYEGDLSSCVVSDTESEHCHRVNNDPESDQVLAPTPPPSSSAVI
ncbi:1-acylglycerol-3-phosphate O-acyltransferase Pnpla3-like isoform X1 [Homarus americanus]|uniref:1-acylglycerol-3-phosphate O-acyltransferase Pnpla3-like isoform X1 n=1 Tax=Homarus americanus TaxID=6706 RepID=UPI001C491F03|nr:1-acylglycerol-3-phosphate O-acyltransferase Pnpla3-like isoform X1 [Homarus americanus]